MTNSYRDQLTQRQRPGLPGAPLPGAVDAPQAQLSTAPHGAGARWVLRVCHLTVARGVGASPGPGCSARFLANPEPPARDC